MIYRFIQNIGDYFTPGFYTENFKDNVFANSGYSSEDIKGFIKNFSGLKEEYFKFKQLVKDQKLQRKYVIKETHAFNSKVMKALGYDITPAYSSWIYVDDSCVVPARSILYNGSKCRLVVMEMQAMIRINEDEQPAGLFEQQYDDDGGVIKEQRYLYSQWSEVIERSVPEGCKISPSKINEAISCIFHLEQDQRPEYILVLAGNVVMLMQQDKWDHGAYLKFDLEDLFSETSVPQLRDYFSLFYLLTSKEVLAGDAQIVLMDKLIEESFKNAYEVTKDLKEGVINAVELLANEAIYFKKTVKGEEFDETDDTFEAKVKDDCLTLIYRLLFIFYAESRPEIGILPMDDDIYAKGYSLDILRDLEQTPLKSEQERNSYFFNDSLWRLFSLIHEGYSSEKGFTVKKIDSPLFDDGKLNILNGVKYRNCVWQEIICSLSLSSEQSKKARGRISYANLGVNQLGSVYESLLAYRGFYAEEDYIEVHKADDPKDGTFLVPRSRMVDFKDNEILHDSKGDVVILPKGKFVYRLNGRDRKKSASYYTPEILTKSTVKYTLKGFVDKLEAGEMKAEELLELKILEPAMGAAAFQNEVINQLAELYLNYRQKEKGTHISPNEYRYELQRAKAYIATKNIYGVDLNPTAIELGKLSLWLNVIHKDMETPFFGHRIALGNAVIGAWFKAYNETELCKVERGKLVSTNWWEKAPHLLHFSKGSQKIIRKTNEIYHFLVPDKNMLGALKIKEEKIAHPNEALRMSKRLKEWTAPISKENIKLLKALSKKIDELISSCIAYQKKVDLVTQNNFAVWGHNTHQNFTFPGFDDKQAFTDSRSQKGNDFFKLRTIMDYWCSLWFWEYEDAALLPTREDYWLDIAQILGVDIMNISSAIDGEPSLFGENNENTESINNDDLIIESVSQNDAEAELRKIKTNTTLFESGPRIPVVQRLARRYSFFHPMLEFIEVFWLRDGFDVICGNPPWLKLEFDELGIISEKYPEVSIRKSSATEVQKLKADMLATSLSLSTLYHIEQYDNYCSGSFLNAVCNYHLLQGQQTDLYKCVLANGFSLLGDNGYMGMLHPDSVYNDPSGQPLRKEMYHRLRYDFQYINELRLFAEIHHETTFGSNVYGGYLTKVSFYSINNLFHPQTIDGCFIHDGSGVCKGIKDDNGWNTASHKDRIVHFTDSELETLNRIEDGESWDTPKMLALQSQSIINIVKKLARFDKHIKDFPVIYRRPLDETNDAKAGNIVRNTKYPSYESCEMIYSGPHIGLCNPIYKTPRSVCRLNSDYDTLNLTLVSDSCSQRTNYVPGVDVQSWIKSTKGFLLGYDSENKPRYSDWLLEYKVAFKEFVGSHSERTLCCAFLPPRCSHINTIQSIAFQDLRLASECVGLCCSLPLDFLFKITNASHVTPGRISMFPLGVNAKIANSIIVRSLLLNCLTNNYKQLWESCYSDDFKKETWAEKSSQLPSFTNLCLKWNPSIALRNYFERRQALIEIDVLAAMGLGLELNELIQMYNIQFGVLRQYDDETYYDSHGDIVYTENRGLNGIGVQRGMWEQIRNQKEGETYVHTIDPAKSELYGGQQVTYYAPYTKCDRIEDYKRAWAHFEKVFEGK